MKISGKPIIHVDNSIKSVDIQNAVNTDKYSLVDKAKNSLEKQMMTAQRSTGFRTQLLNKGLAMPVVGQRDGPQVMNAASALQEAQGKIPSYSRALESEREQQIQLGPQGAMGDQSRQKGKQDVSVKIEKLLRAIEDKLDATPENNIVEESVQRSMFGIFARNFKQFQDQQTGDLDKILRNFFRNSIILDDITSKYL